MPTAFEEIRRVLKDEGRVLIGCELSPSPASLRYQEKIPNMKIYTPGQLATYLEMAGFGNVQIFKDKKKSFCLLAQQ